MFNDTLFSQINPLMVFGIICSILGLYFINKAYRTYSQEIPWFNENPLTLKQLPLFTEKYSIKNMINQNEVLICISDDDYESMDDTAKSKLYKSFVTDGSSELLEIAPVQYGVFKRLSLNECFGWSIPLYLSGFPSVGRGTFIVQDFSRSFQRLCDTKTKRKNGKVLVYVFGAFICAVGVYSAL